MEDKESIIQKIKSDIEDLLKRKSLLSDKIERRNLSLEIKKIRKRLYWRTRPQKKRRTKRFSELTSEQMEKRHKSNKLYKERNREKLLQRFRDYEKRQEVIDRRAKYNAARRDSGRQAEYQKEYYLKNKEEISSKNKRYYKNNKEKAELYSINWRGKNAEHCKNRAREYNKINGKRNREKQKLKAKNNPGFRAERRLRSRIQSALRSQNSKKSYVTKEILGCSLERARNHLESLFLEGMSWLNMEEWVIDHVIPCASFDLSNLEHQKLCFNYTNLQPLWKADNDNKNDNMPNGISARKYPKGIGERFSKDPDFETSFDRRNTYIIEFSDGSTCEVNNLFVIWEDGKVVYKISNKTYTYEGTFGIYKKNEYTQ